jgi:hypothetical protein
MDAVDVTTQAKCMVSCVTCVAVAGWVGRGAGTEGSADHGLGGLDLALLWCCLSVVCWQSNFRCLPVYPLRSVSCTRTRTLAYTHTLTHTHTHERFHERLRSIAASFGSTPDSSDQVPNKAASRHRTFVCDKNTSRTECICGCTTCPCLLRDIFAQNAARRP